MSTWVVGGRSGHTPSPEIIGAVEGIRICGWGSRNIVVEAEEAAALRLAEVLGCNYIVEAMVYFQTETFGMHNVHELLAVLMDGSTRKSPYFAKDRAKAARATQMIGQGSPRSSTAAYARACGNLANTGEYGADDIVFVSAEGARTGRFAASAGGVAQGAYANIARAAAAGAKFVVDVAADRSRSYNVGEREVEVLLVALGYREVEPGLFSKE